MKKLTVLFLSIIVSLVSVLPVSADLTVVPCPDDWDYHDSISFDQILDNAQIDLKVVGEVYVEVNKSKQIDVQVVLNGTTLVENPELQWNTSDSSVVSVNADGVVKGVSLGGAHVTVECKGVSRAIYVHVVEGIDVKLSKTKYEYNGKEKKPSVTVTNNDGDKLEVGTDYNVSYQSGRKNIGKYKVVVTFINAYSYKDAETLTFEIVPKGTSFKKVTGGKKSITFTWKKQKKEINGYQLQLSTKKSMKNAKLKTVSGKNKTKKKVSGLLAKKKYFVRIRTYKTVKIDGKNVKMYSDWSAVKKVKTKK